jgi:hypothetical protein
MANVSASGSRSSLAPERQLSGTRRTAGYDWHQALSRLCMSRPNSATGRRTILLRELPPLPEGMCPRHSLGLRRAPSPAA